MHRKKRDKYIYNDIKYVINELYLAITLETREIQQTNTSTYTQNNISKIKVKNNVTGQWEDISNVVDFNVSK